MTTATRASAGGGVQSVERVFDILELMASAGGAIGVSELADRAGLPLPTIHRLIRTLVDRGYVRQLPTRRYALGPKLIRLGGQCYPAHRVLVATSPVGFGRAHR